MQRMKINMDGFDAILMVGVALFAYAAPEAVGGNGYLSAYVVGLILGNTGSYGKKHLFGFFDGFTGLMQMGVFFLLGLLSFPSALVHWALPGLGVALFLTFVARPLAVALLLTPLRSSLAQSVGFTNVTCVNLHDLNMFTALVSSDKIDKITINGKAIASGGKIYMPDVPIVITYHGR